MRRHIVPLLVLALTASACGDSSSTSAADGLEVCAWNGFPDWADEPVNGVNLLADQTEYAAGDSATFRWEVDEDVSEVIVGDEWLINCFDGEVEHLAWQTDGVFRENPTSIITSEPLGGDDDGWGPSPATVPIPSGTPNGFYTVVVEGVIFDESGESLGGMEFDASFLVVTSD